MMVYVNKPNTFFNTDAFDEALSDAGVAGGRSVVVGDTIRVTGTVDAEAVQAVLSGYTPPEPTPTPSLGGRLAEVERRLDSVPSAADLNELRQTLGGTA